MLRHHYTCDYCGVQNVRVDWELPNGWQVIEAQAGNIEGIDAQKHFCSEACMSMWAMDVENQREAQRKLLENS